MMGFDSRKLPRLIACDVDGTLLPRGVVDLPDRTVDLIRAAIDAGIVFAPASGREYVGLKNLFGVIGRDIPYIAGNGSVAYVGDEVVFRTEMDRDLATEIVRTAIALPECELFISGATTCHVQTDNPDYVEHLEKTYKFEVNVVEDATDIDEPYSKISIFYAGLDADESLWKSRFGSRCHVVVSGAEWVDLMPFDANKGVATRAVCDRLSISPRDCMAFGDAPNDIEMLELVGSSYAMETADDKVKSCATGTTPTVEAVLERLLAS